MARGAANPPPAAREATVRGVEVEWTRRWASVTPLTPYFNGLPLGVATIRPRSTSAALLANPVCACR